MNKLNFERFYPYIFGCVGAIIWWEVSLAFPKGDAILSATLTVSGIFVGFLATSKAILLSLNSSVLADIKKSGYIKELVSYIGEAIWFNLGFCTFNVLGFFDLQQKSWFAVIWIMLGIISLMTFVRVTDIMLKIFKRS